MLARQVRQVQKYVQANLACTIEGFVLGASGRRRFGQPCCGCGVKPFQLPLKSKCCSDFLIFTCERSPFKIEVDIQRQPQFGVQNLRVFRSEVFGSRTDKCFIGYPVLRQLVGRRQIGMVFIGGQQEQSTVSRLSWPICEIRRILRFVPFNLVWHIAAESLLHCRTPTSDSLLNFVCRLGRRRLTAGINHGVLSPLLTRHLLNDVLPFAPVKSRERSDIGIEGQGCLPNESIVFVERENRFR